jgi:uncharacterized protein YbaA (DUF1428 family)
MEGASPEIDQSTSTQENHNMPEYVDGFVIPLKKTRLAEYRRVARKAAKVWKEHGALDYRECLGDVLANQWGAQFPKLAGAKKDETVLFSWITYKSRKHRDQVNKKVMADQRLKNMANECEKIFDCKRMAYGGFKTIVSI